MKFLKIIAGYVQFFEIFSTKVAVRGELKRTDGDLNLAKSVKADCCFLSSYWVLCRPHAGVYVCSMDCIPKGYWASWRGGWRRRPEWTERSLGRWGGRSQRKFRGPIEKLETDSCAMYVTTLQVLTWSVGSTGWICKEKFEYVWVMIEFVYVLWNIMANADWFCVDVHHVQDVGSNTLKKKHIKI